jgi:aldehyde:ferredoxin oxidoreductase
MNGFVGKILRVDLTVKTITTIDTKKYEHWGGGHGMGSALFWDLVEDKTIDGFDAKNVVTIMTSPLSGTLVPGSAARTEVQGIGVQSSPIGWFTRSNFGGRFSPMLKFAGWDGIVIGGRAESPVWLDIRDSDVQLRDARALWGKDTWETQQYIWDEIGTDKRYSGWNDPQNDHTTSTQRPAVIAIGQAGENLCRVASLVHDAGHGSGQGGFGAVWGSKKLKAISVVGTGSISVAHPHELIEARLWAKKSYSFNIDDAEQVKEISSATFNLGFGSPAMPGSLWHRPKEARPHACIGCHTSCRSRFGTGLGNESTCATSLMYAPFDIRRHSSTLTRALFSVLDRAGQKGATFGLALTIGKQTPAAYGASDLIQKYGINSVEVMVGLQYLQKLHQKGVIGPGREIACDLPFDHIGSMDFAERLTRMIAFREGIGDDMAEGFYRAAQRWGRLEEDIATGLLPYPCWGLPDHYDARAHLEWGYGSLLGDRDINEHDFIFPLHLVPCLAKWQKKKPPFSAQEVVETIAEKLAPYEGDAMMLDFSTENMYSSHLVKLIAWHRHYSRFWKQSALYCNYLFADFCNPRARDGKGLTGEGEPKFYNAVTGGNMSFVDGMELGKKIWNLDNAIWTLQGRHRDMVHFAPYIYTVDFTGVGSLSKYFMPAKKKGRWSYTPLKRRHHDREKFEAWKTAYYQFEGWDLKTGWPTRETLESQGMGNVADELQKNGRLGSADG